MTLLNLYINADARLIIRMRKNILLKFKYSTCC